MFNPGNREKIEDKRVDADLAETNLMNRLFLRLGAKEKRFTKVDFR